MKNRQKINRSAYFCLFFCFGVLGLSIAVGVSAALDTPTAAPPGDNTVPYITIGDDNQVKTGALRLGTNDASGPFKYQLEVQGEGAQINQAIIDQKLKVSESGDTLYVDPEANRVCIGPCLGLDGSKLEVSGGPMTVDNAAGEGVHAESTETEAIKGTGTESGVRGVAYGEDNYGIWAVNPLNTPVSGENTGYLYSAIGAFSDSGYAIYGTNENTAGLWAGYFGGLLESSRDVVGAKFVPTQLQSSMVSYTVGQELMDLTIGPNTVRYYDGTNVWLSRGNTLMKVRVPDGFSLLDVSFGGEVADVIYDGTALWAVAADNTVRRIDPVSGDVRCSLDLTSISVSDPRGIAFSGQGTVQDHELNRFYWVTATADTGEGVIVKIRYDADTPNCGLVAGGIVEVTPEDVQVGRIIYNGDMLYAIASGDDGGYVVALNPSSADAAIYQNVIGNSPTDIFYDNAYYWVTNGADDSVTRFYLSGSRICSLKDPSTLDWKSCAVNSDCVGGSSEDLGGCFPVPVPYGSFATSDSPVAIAFDGVHIWTADAGTGTLSALKAADPNDRETFSLGFSPTGMRFDGSSLWVSGPTGLTKRYSGVGYGTTDLSGTLTLQNIDPLTEQKGSFSIDGSATVGMGFIADGDLSAQNNVWGGETVGDTLGDGINPFPGNSTQTCPTGHFLTDISVDASGRVTKIECRPL
ncbi:MAG: hypothetical protein PHY34_02740 [Patescibacteria group bacterium]|nr:hypothetical protein [Patescibacteria group bacterium]MDD5715441.1 hypothetical protein [Patescibacteria group bacterium]